MEIKDLKMVEQIENECFKIPWPMSAFLQVLTMKDTLSVVWDESGDIIGYGMVIQLKSSVHIVNLAVKPSYRRKGIGSRILLNFIRYGEELGKKVATLEVRTSNLPAINLYRKFGFKKVEVKKSYYPDGEDAIVMRKELNFGVQNR
ncbi:MAG: ribosomal protein S18-alanine N-acetyltransferase [bacterium]|nr:ribosomal protein S18-alanine N-acetyltransferase [bacterium]